MPEIKITLLVENTAKGRNILAEHGLAYWIETPAGNVLFDTGQGFVLEHNAQALNINLEQAAAVVLSHGHYDHTGGLEHILKKLPQDVPLYLHRDALLERYSQDARGQTRPVNAAFMHRELPSQAERLHPVGGAQNILPGLFISGVIPRKQEYEDTGGAFFLDSQAQKKDPIRDDMALYFKARAGWVIVLGCAHAGVVNTLEHIHQNVGGDTIHAVIGGMHLLHANEARLQQTYQAFDEYGISLIAPCHCTGMRAIAGFWKHFPQQVTEAHAGKTFSFEIEPQESS